MQYGYVRNADKLRGVIHVLAGHEAEIKQYFLAGLTPRIATLEKDEDKLVKLFTIANADRLFTGRENLKLIEAVAGFSQGLKDIHQYDSMEPQSAHKSFLEWLCGSISGMDQKTANLFLKYVIVLHDELEIGLLPWKSWEPYLHVPLDRWVMRLMGRDYLGVCGENYERDFRKYYKKKEKYDYPSPSFGKSEYWELQKDLASVAALANQAPIILDGLWFVGNKYCTYHPLLCDICWLRKMCNRARARMVLPIVSTKQEREEERRRVRKERNRVFTEILKEFKEWQQANPGTTDDDLHKFLEWKKEHGKLHERE